MNVAIYAGNFNADGSKSRYYVDTVSLNEFRQDLYSKDYCQEQITFTPDFVEFTFFNETESAIITIPFKEKVFFLDI